MIATIARVEPSCWAPDLCLCDDCTGLTGPVLSPGDLSPGDDGSFPYAQVGTATGTRAAGGSTGPTTTRLRSPWWVSCRDDRSLVHALSSTRKRDQLDTLLRELDPRGRTIDPRALLGSAAPTGPASPTARETGLPGGTCTGQYVKVQCSDGHVAYKPSFCGRHGCTECARGNSTKRGHRVMTKTGGRGYGRYIVTTPHALRPYVNASNAREVSKLIYLVIRHYYRVMYRRPELEIGAVVAMHPCGEDLTTFKPHWELFVPLLAWDRGEAVQLRWVATALDGLKADMALLWSGLSESWEAPYEPRDFENLYYEFVKRPGKRAERISVMQHRVSYAFRTFPEWYRGGWRWTIQRLGLVSPRGPMEWQEAVRWEPPDAVCECCGAPMLPETVLVSYWDGHHADRIMEYFSTKAEGT